jgi:hypothetical protein
LASGTRRVLELIKAGQLATGKDFRQAALVSQHGDGSNDILLAHILEVTALGKGAPEARRMSALTVDRYPTRLGQPQVFGTQFKSPNAADPTAWTMDPYDPGLISDALRALNCVGPVAKQREVLEALRRGPEPSDDLACAETK